MPHLDPRNDFKDDGGTPAYRRRQAEARLGPFGQWYRRASPLDVLILSLFGSLLLLAAVYVIPLAIILIVT